MCIFRPGSGSPREPPIPRVSASANVNVSNAPPTITTLMIAAYIRGQRTLRNSSSCSSHKRHNNTYTHTLIKGLTMARMALLLVVLLGLLAIGNIDACGATSTRRLKQAYSKPEDTYTKPQDPSPTPQDSYTKPQDPYTKPQGPKHNPKHHDASITIHDWTYTLMTVPQPFNWLAATVQKGCPPNSRFSGFVTKKDKDAILKIAPHVKIWVNADTYNGTVPVKMPGCQNITWIDNTALPKLPYVCKAPVLKRKWMTIDKTLYVLTGTLIDFNTLATTKGNCSQGCPDGMTWSTMSGDDATAAVMLAPHFTIWVNDITVNGMVPVKLAEQDRMTYFDNQELPWMPFICKGPAPVIQWLT